MITVATRFSCCSTRYYLLGIQDSMCSREAYQIKEILPQSDLRPLALSLCAGGKRRMSTAAGGRQIKYSLITLHILKCLGEEITSLFGFYCAVQRQNHFFFVICYTHNFIGSTFREKYCTTLYHQSDFTFSKLLQKLLFSTPKYVKPYIMGQQLPHNRIHSYGHNIVIKMCAKNNNSI